MIDIPSIADNLPAGIYRTTLDGRFVYANQALADLLGYSDPTALKQVKVQFLYKDAVDRDAWIKDFENNSVPVITREFEWRRLGGELLKVVDSARAIRSNSKIIGFEGVIQVIQDVTFAATHTERKEIHCFHSGHNQETLDRLMDFLPVCVIRKNKKREFTFVNKNFCDVEGVTKDQVLNTKNTDKLMWNEEIDNKYCKTDEQVFKTKNTIQYQEKHLYSDNRTLDVHVLKIPLFSPSGDGDDVVGLEVHYWDFETLAYKYHEQKQARRIEQLLNTPGASTAVYEHDFDGFFSYLSPAALALLELEEKPDRFKIQDTIAPEYIEIATSQIRAKKANPRMPDTLTTYEIEILSKSGRRIPVEVNSRSIFREGKRSTIIGYVRDLSREREWVNERLQEVNHRVKNNLQTVVALLRRETASVSENNRSILLDCESRIYAIADLHEELYKTNRTNQVEVHGSLNRLIDRVVETYRRPWQEIDVRKSMTDSIVLSLDAMVPLTLTVQEIVANAFKHAFPKKRNDETKTRGFILINFGRVFGIPNRFYLNINDTGIGLPSDFQRESSKSLGMSLIFGLIEKQLKGKVEISIQQGTFYKIEFSDPTPVVQTKGLEK
jgi:PAS domain S-box-containing protein